MAIVSSMNNRLTLLPGIFCEGTNAVFVRDMLDGIHITIEPEKESVSSLYFNSDDFSHQKLHIHVNFQHPHATFHLFGLYQLNQNQSVDIYTEMNHFVPFCESNQTWKGVLENASKAVFTGKIIVHPLAQKTKAYLSNKNLLLSLDAEIKTEPQLEIYADDVKCSHGATVGFLDENALFYLRSRGIEKESATKILINAFVDEILDKMSGDEIC